MVTPVIQPLRRCPLALRNDISPELQSMLDGDIVEQVHASPWISNLMVAKKKSGGLRLFVDLRTVNKAIIPDKYPLPTTEELTAQFHGSTVFSKLDLCQGYLQVPLHNESRNLTAFIMASIFAGIPGVAIYLDDIVIHGATAKRP